MSSGEETLVETTAETSAEEVTVVTMVGMLVEISTGDSSRPRSDNFNMRSHGGIEVRDLNDHEAAMVLALRESLRESDTGN